MNFETQPKKNILMHHIAQLAVFGSIFSVSACSFVEPIPGTHHIILSNDLASCQKVSQFESRVRTKHFLIERNEQAIANELQILAQNEALTNNANAIWPATKIEDGVQLFDILKCREKS